MKKRFYFISILILFCLNILFYNKLVFSNLTYFQRDLMIQFKPWKIFINSYLKNLFNPNSIYLDFLPLWNFYNHCGHPFIANPQSQIFYPFSLIFCIIKDFVVAYKFFLILHFFLSTLFMFILLKKKLSFVSSLCGSIIWTFNGYMLSRTEFLSVFSTIIWLPLLVYLFSFISKKFEFKKIILISIIIAIQFLAGHPQMWFYSIVFLLLHAIYQSYKYNSYCPIISFLISLFLSILISAAQFFPTTEFLFHSTRFGKEIKNIAQFGINYKEAILGSLNFKDLVNLFYPFNWQFNIKDFYSSKILTIPNYWWCTFYIGISAVCLSIIGFFSMKNIIEKIFYLLIIFLFISYSLGENFVLFNLLYKFVPFIRFFRYPSTSMFVVIFILCLFIGYGTEFFVLRIKKYNQYITFLIPLVCFIELYLYSSKISILLPKSILYESTKTINFLIKNTQSDKYPYRFALTPMTQKLSSVKGKTLYEAIVNYRNRLFGDINLEYSLLNFRGQDIELRNYYKFLDCVYSCNSLDESIPYFSISNTKYIISVILQKTKLAKLIQDDEIKIYENPFVLPPVFLVTEKIVNADLDDSLELIKKLKFKLFNTVILHNNNIHNLKYNHLSTTFEIEKFIYHNNRIYIETNSQQDGFLVLPQNFYPGWQCLINKQRTKIYHCNIFMMCIYLPKGRNKIYFYYDPVSFKIGSIISLVSLLFVIIYLYETSTPQSLQFLYQKDESCQD